MCDAISPHAADPAANCAAAKQKAAAKKLNDKVKCHGKAIKKGLDVDPACLAKAESKFDVSFAKAEGKGGCVTEGDAASIELLIDDTLAQLLAALPPASPCGGGETFCSGNCVDLTSDANNCGGCGIACTSPSECVNGACEDLGCFLRDEPGCSDCACASELDPSDSCLTTGWDCDCAYACTIGGGHCFGTCDGQDGGACQAYVNNSACQQCIDNASSTDIYRFACSFAAVEDGCDPLASNTNTCALYANFTNCDSVCCP